MLKIVTWNVNSIRVRLPLLKELITEHNPDIICLQELKCTANHFPLQELNNLSYKVYLNSQKNYNGVAILSKTIANQVITQFVQNPIPDQARFIECSFNTCIGDIRLISLYAPNGNAVGSEKFLTKLQFFDALINYIHNKKSHKEKLFIGADYNIAPFDIDVYSADKLKNTTCFTTIEKKKLRSILNSGFIDNFRIKHPQVQAFSWWDYRGRAFEQNQGMRIDTILSTSNVLQHLQDCIIDYRMRSKSRPSDHAPVIGIYNI